MRASRLLPSFLLTVSLVFGLPAAWGQVPAAIADQIAMADAAEQAGDRPGAIAALEEALAIDPFEVGTLLRVGGLYLETQQYQKAEGVFARVFLREPRSVAASLGLARSYALQGMPDEAQAQLTTARQWDPAAPVGTLERDVQIAFARSWLQLPDYEQTDFALDQALALDPACAECYVIRAQMNLGRYEYVAALAAVEQALAITPGDYATLWLAAQIAQGWSEYDAQRGYLDRALAANPDAVEALVMRGALLLQEYDERIPAGSDFARALALAPENVEALAGRARIHSLAGEEAEALALYERLLPLQPEHAEANTAVLFQQFLDGERQSIIDFAEGEAAFYPYEGECGYLLDWLHLLREQEEGTLSGRTYRNPYAGEQMYMEYYVPASAADAQSQLDYLNTELANPEYGDDPWIRFERARVMAYLGHAEGALAEIRAAEAHPDYLYWFDGSFLETDLLWTLKQPDAALAELNEWLLNPDVTSYEYSHRQVLERKLAILEDQREWAGALEVARELSWHVEWGPYELSTDWYLAAAHAEGRLGTEDEGRAWLSQGLARASQAIAEDDAYTNLYLERARLHAALGDFASARADVQRVLDDQDSRWIHPKAEAAMARYAQGETLLQSVLALTPQIAAEPGNLHLRLARVEAYAALGQAREAVDDLDVVIEAEPSNAYALFLRGAVFAEEPVQSVRALRDLNWALTHDPYDARVYLARAKVYQLKGDVERREADLLRAYELDPGNLEALVAAGQVYLKRTEPTDWRLAADIFGRALTIEPSHTDALLGHAQAQLELGNLDEAQAGFEAVLRARPKDLAAHEGLSYVRMWQGDYRGAREQVRVLLRLDQWRIPARFEEYGGC